MSRRVTGLAVMAMALASALPASAQTIGLRLRDSAQVLLAPSAPLRVPVVLDLGAAGSANLAALQAALTWDAALLRFDSLVAVPGSGLTLTVQAGEAATGRVRFSAYGSSAVSASGPLAEVFLTARTATGGTWLTLVPEVAGAEDGSSVLPLLRTRQLGACVASGTGVWGDVNDDAVVNVLDAQQIARFGVGLSVAQPAAMAARGDVTADGAVNVLDAQQIARASVGLSAAPRIGRSAYTPPPVASLTVSRLWPLVLPLQAC